MRRIRRLGTGMLLWWGSRIEGGFVWLRRCVEERHIGMVVYMVQVHAIDAQM